MGTNISKTATSMGGENNLETTTDRGSLHPQGLYADSPTDYCVKVVKKFIRDGKLAPFYRGKRSVISYATIEFMYYIT